MSRTLSNMSRALSSYGSQAAGIQRDASRNATMLRMRAADIRADATRQRGQNFAGMATGVGQMVGQGILEAPIRKRQQQAHEMNMARGSQQLAIGDQQIADMEEARGERQRIKARRQKYVGIISEHYGDSVATMTALKDAGLIAELKLYRQNMLDLRGQIAKTSLAEAKEVSTTARLASETIGGLLRLEEGPARDEQYQVARSRVLALAPDLEGMMPETPDATTYEVLADTAATLRSGADQAGMDDAAFNRADRWWKKQENEDAKGQDVFNKAIKKMSGVNKGAWESELKFQSKRIEKFSPEHLETFKSLTGGGHSRETKADLKKFSGEGPEFSGAYSNYRNDALERGEDPMSFLDFMRAMWRGRRSGSGKKEEQEGILTPSQALAVLRSVEAAAKERRDAEERFWDMPMDEVEKTVALERGWYLKELREMAMNEDPEPEFVEVKGKRYRKVGPDQYVVDPK